MFNSRCALENKIEGAPIMQFSRFHISVLSAIFLGLSNGGGIASEAIVIGGSVALSGNYSKSAEFQLQGIELWVEDTNRNGGLLGRKLEFKFYDDRSDPGTGVRLYEKLIVEDRVDLIMGPYSSPVTAAVSAVAEKHQMMMLAPLASANSIWERGFKYTFQVPTASDQLFTGGIEIAGQANIKTIGVMGEDSGYPRTALPPTSKMAKERGMKVVDLGYYPKGTKDFSAMIARAKSEQVELLLCGCYEPDSIQLTRQAKELGYNAKVYLFGVGPALPEFKTALGVDSEFIMAADHWMPEVLTPGNKEFVERFIKKFGREPNYHAAAAYGAMQILGMAVKAVGAINQNRIRDYVASLDTTTLYGRFKVDATGAQIGKTGFIIQWLEGKKKIVWPADAAEAKPLVPAPAWVSRRN